MSRYLCLFIYITRDSIHMVTVDKTLTIVWQDPWRVFNEDETWSGSQSLADSSFCLLQSVLLILFILIPPHTHVLLYNWGYMYCCSLPALFPASHHSSFNLTLLTCGLNPMVSKHRCIVLNLTLLIEADATSLSPLLWPLRYLYKHYKNALWEIDSVDWGWRHISVSFTVAINK